jgi:SAM-dependent methyltransferase
VTLSEALARSTGGVRVAARRLAAALRRDRRLLNLRSPPGTIFGQEDAVFLRALIEHALADASGPARWHITRVAMYRALENALAPLDTSARRCLCISQSRPLARVLGLRKSAMTVTSFPEVDILALPYADGEFDFVVADQVLEHVAGDPFLAMAECLRVAKPGGAIVHTTCFINFMHQLPTDFWRFSPAALELLARHAGGEDIAVGGWGSRDAWTYMELGFRMRKVPEVPGNPIFELAMRNEKRWPVTTWVRFRKPA